MTNRYADDIRRIVGDDSDKRGLSAAPTKPAIPGKRGVGYLTREGTASGASGSPGAQTPNDTFDPLDFFDKGLEGFSDVEGDDGNTSPDPNGGTNSSGSNKTDGTGKFDAADVIDGDGPKVSESTEYNGQVRNNENAQVLNELNDVTVGGKLLDIRFDGTNSPLAATSDDNGDPLTDEWLCTILTGEETGEYCEVDQLGFQQGYYWEMAGSGNPTPEQGAAPYATAKLAKAYLDANPPGGRTGPFSIIELTPSGSPATLYNVKYDGTSGGDFTLVLSRVDCVTLPPDDAASCPASAPAEEFYSDDVNTKVRFDGAVFKTSIYAPDPPLTLSHQNKSIIDGSFASGSRFIRLEATREGGFLISERDTLGGTATGAVQVFRPNGTLKEVVSEAEADYYRPDPNS